MTGILQLDNPAWNALVSVHSEFAVGAGNALRYWRGVLPFVGFKDGGSEALSRLDKVLSSGEIIFLIGAMPPLPSEWRIEKELPCLQMVFADNHYQADKSVAVEAMREENRNEMYDLIQAVQPGYYELNTPALGNYYGIRDGGKLVAVAGERMRMTGLTEISAICTAPQYTGRGYAQQLIHRLCTDSIEQDVTPFLHVLTTNTRAISVYERMGFKTRREISFWKIIC